MIYLTFNNITFDNKESCNDYIKVYDGVNSSNPLIETVCGSTNPGVISSAGHNLFIHFHTDGSGRSNGAQFTWIMGKL